MQPCYGPRRPGQHGVRKRYHQRRAFRLDDVTAIGIAVTEVQSDLHIGRYARRRAGECCREKIQRRVLLQAGAVAEQCLNDFDGDVPLDREILMRISRAIVATSRK